MPREGSYVRWQSIAIAQLGYAVGLILSLATASLGFGLTLVKDPNYVPRCWGKSVMFASLVFLMMSIIVGLWCAINRLCDFRKTRSIARDREKWEEEHVGKCEIDTCLAVRRAETERLGKWTWLLFRWQVGTFFSGVTALVVAFAIIYRGKLF
jgi:hypothetical protein